MSARRVVVTGVGLATALGATREASWAGLLAGRCGIGPMTLFDADGFRSRLAAEAPMEAVDVAFSPLERRRLSRADRIGIQAATEALCDAGVTDSGVDRSRVGVFLGAGTADLLRSERFYHTMKTRGIARTRPSDVRNHFPNTPNDVIAHRFGFEGPRRCVIAACSSSTIAIGQAVDAIRAGRADAAIAGGTDALARLTYSGFNQLKLMDVEPCRPFDRSRAGMNIGEGAGMLLLESLDHATRRGARIYAEMAGYALGCEAHHATAPEPDGTPLSNIVRAALEDARVPASDVDHVNAHGTATPQNDLSEARALRRIFGHRARRVPVTSAKSMIGHCLGAAGAVEAAILVLTIARSVIPPTIHHGDTDPECDLDVVANEAREVPVRCGVSTSLAFGGNDSALVVTSFDAAR
ncbi:MAG: beta-ketoacyl synthase [Vicinamibacterales bacterium]